MLVFTQTCHLVAGQQYSYQTPPGSTRPRRGQQLSRPLPSPSPALPPSSSSSPGIPISSHYFSPTSPPTSQYKTEEDSGFESLVTTNSDSGSSSSHQVHLGEGGHSTWNSQNYKNISRCPCPPADPHAPTWHLRGTTEEEELHCPLTKTCEEVLHHSLRFGQLVPSSNREIHLIFTTWVPLQFMRSARKKGGHSGIQV